MNTIRCEGLDGSNPLHFLAALGVLRLTEKIAPGARMGWVRMTGMWHPELMTNIVFDSLVRDVVNWLHELARTVGTDPIARREAERTKTELKRLNEQLKVERSRIKEELRRQKVKGEEAKKIQDKHLSVVLEHIANEERNLETGRMKLAAAYGEGIAHFGDVIGVAPGIVRSRAVSAVGAFLANHSSNNPGTADAEILGSHLPALACDQVTDGDRVVPTRYSFGNGSGGQYLLKDWRNLAAVVTVEQVKATLSGVGERFVEGVTNLNWDPSANRSYALNWNKPENDLKKTDLAANALAYIGLGLMSVVPAGGRLEAVGWGPEDEWTWPIWEPRIRLAVVRSLLVQETLMKEECDANALVAIGVVEVRRCERVDPTGQGRPFFSPSRPV